ncbi:MAG: cation-translocating P-type ATPase, partial [Lachnospiraceae bacterium]
MLGLTSEEAKQRAAQGLANVQIDKSAKTKKDILRENILTYFNLIFLILAILLIIAGSYKSLTFLPVIIANTLIGILQELHAKKVLDELSIMNAVRCDV